MNMWVNIICGKNKNDMSIVAALFQVKVSSAKDWFDIGKKRNELYPLSTQMF